MNNLLPTLNRSFNKPTKFYNERRVGVEAVRKASKLCRQAFNSLLKDETVVKDDKSPVTVADYSAQAIISSILAENFPQDPIVGEEDAEFLRTKEGEKVSIKIAELVNSSFKKPKTLQQILDAIDRGKFGGGPKGRFWALDPIDGTKGFLRGGQFAVCLALIVDGSVELGILGCPNLPLKENDLKRGVIFAAERGLGAYQQPLEEEGIDWEPIKMNLVSDVSKARFCESVESGHSSHDLSARIASLLNISSSPIRMDSQCKYGSIARGDGDMYLRLPTNPSYQEKIWDHAAGSLLVEEAGGQVTDVAGRPLDFSRGRTLAINQGVVAAHASLHPALISAVKSALQL